MTVRARVRVRVRACVRVRAPMHSLVPSVSCPSAGKNENQDDEVKENENQT